MKKQSSIEWLFEQLEFNDSVSRHELLEQAKQMHKQELIESWDSGEANWLFHARKKGNQTEREIRTANCKNYEFD